jgi:hypothetical protein
MIDSFLDRPGQLASEHSPEQLSGLVVGQFCADMYLGRGLRRPQPGAHPGSELLLLDPLAGSEDDHRDGSLPPLDIRHAHDRGLGHRRMLEQNVLDLAR